MLIERIKSWFKNFWYEYSFEIIATSVGIMIVLLLIFGGWKAIKLDDERQKEEDLLIYNHGIHDVCGGNWIYNDNFSHWYRYKCDKCNATFDASEYITKEDVLNAKNH